MISIRRDIIKIILLILALLIFVVSTAFVLVNATPPMPVGVCGKITVDGNILTEGIITIKNMDTDETVNVEIDGNSGFYVISISGTSGDTINASIYYNGKYYSNETIIDTTKATQWCNITIITEEEPPPNPPEPEENKKPVIVFPDEIVGYVGEEIMFNASSCYDPDGKITIYGWSIYDYPPFSKTGVSFVHTWHEEKNIVGTLTIYDDHMSLVSKSFSIKIIKENNGDGDDDQIPITIPPIADFTYEGYFKYNTTLYLNSTSYDPDGEITNWTWNVDGNTIYGKNTTFLLPYSDGDYYWLTISLIVTDDDGIMNQKEETIRINKTDEGTENYNIIILSDKDVFIAIKSDDNHVIKQDYGTMFNYTLPNGSYQVVYAYNGKEYSENIELDKDTTLTINVGDDEGNKIPFGGISLIIISLINALVITLFRNRRRDKRWK